MNAKGTAIVGRHMKKGELISQRSEILFPSHCASVGVCFEAPLGLDKSKGFRASSAPDQVPSYGISLLLRCTPL